MRGGGSGPCKFPSFIDNINKHCLKMINGNIYFGSFRNLETETIKKKTFPIEIWE